MGRWSKRRPPRSDDALAITLALAYLLAVAVLSAIALQNAQALAG